MVPQILIIEDDQIQADDLKQRLEKLGISVKVISTEAKFRQHIRDEDVKRYSLAVVDMMLRWTDPAPDMEMPPSDVVEEGSYTAGLRCCRALAARGVRCIIYTALSRNKIPQKRGDDFEIIQKGGNAFSMLIEKIRPTA
jgi:CheY-like chemotaxis protein